MQHFFHFQQLVTFAFHHFGHRDAGHARYDFGYFVRANFGAEEFVLFFALRIAFCCLQLRTQFRQLAVFEFGRAGKIALTFGLFDFDFDVVHLFLNVGGAGRRGFFGFPDFVQISVFFLQTVDFFVYQLQTFFAGIVALFGNVHFFHFELDDAAVKFIHLLGFAVQLHFDTAGSFVNQINRFVG